MSGGRKITWRVAGAAVAVAVFLFAVLWVLTQRPRAVPVLARSPSVSLVSADASSRSLSNAVLPRVAPTDRAISAEGCGIGSASDDLIIAAGSKTKERWEAELLDSSDSHARAVGLMIRRVELQSNSPVLAEESRDELVQLAAGSRDPALYALAVGLCRMPAFHSDSDDISDASLSSNTPGACQRISLSEWTRVDPSNASPWILIAQDARKKNDTQAEATAFAKAADAHNIDNYSDSLLSYGLSELPQGITPAEKMSLAIELIGYEAASGGAGLSEISRYCSDAAVRQDETHAECGAIADLLISRGSTLLTFSVGVRIGARVGWSPERLQSLSQEREALYALLPKDAYGMSCEYVNRTNEFFDKRAQLGELGALRELRDHTDAVTTTAGSTITSSQFSSDPPRSITRK
jgi:hypothetical protein